MNIAFLKVITFIIVAIVVLVLLFLFIKTRKVKKYRDCVSYLDKEKNSLETAPIVAELSKVEPIIKNEKMEEKYKEWASVFDHVKNEDISKMSDNIVDLDILIDKKDYKNFAIEYSNAELFLYRIKNKVGHILKEIEDINGSEEKYRDIITKLKAKYRELNKIFEANKENYDGIEGIIELQFENIEKRFQDFEDLMEVNDYSEVMHIVKAVDTMVDHMSIVIDESPDLILLATKVIPKRIEQIKETYDEMVKEDYPLEYLNIEYNVDESLKKVNEIYDRIKVLNLVDCMFELKTMLEYLDSLFSEFEKERIARKEYEDEIGSFSNKLNKTVSIVKDIYKQIDDIKNMYDLTDNDIQVIDDVNKRLQTLKKDYNKSIRRLSSSKTPYSKINNDLTEYTEKLKYIEDDLDVSLKSLGNMYNDEVRAREQLNDIQDMLSKSKLHMRDYKLPIVSDTYFVQLNEANEAIAEIIKELENKPIAISTLNTRVDTARDLVLKVYNATNDMIRDANICESLIIYCNKYRSGDAKIDREISNAEKLFFKGNYTKAIDTVLNAIDTVDPNIKEKVGKIYG